MGREPGNGFVLGMSKKNDKPTPLKKKYNKIQEPRLDEEEDFRRNKKKKEWCKRGCGFMIIFSMKREKQTMMGRILERVQTGFQIYAEIKYMDVYGA